MNGGDKQKQRKIDVQRGKGVQFECMYPKRSGVGGTHEMNAKYAMDLT
jgi:hypothetical protein